MSKMKRYAAAGTIMILPYLMGIKSRIQKRKRKQDIETLIAEGSESTIFVGLNLVPTRIDAVICTINQRSSNGGQYYKNQQKRAQTNFNSQRRIYARG